MVDQILINWGLESKFSEEDVFRVEGILDVNTIEYFPCPKEPNIKGGMYYNIRIIEKYWVNHLCNSLITLIINRILSWLILFSDNTSATPSKTDNRRYNSYGCRGFFPVTSFASHSCANNTFHKRKNMNSELDEIYLNHKQEKLEPQEIILETRAKVDIQEVGMISF